MGRRKVGKVTPDVASLTSPDEPPPLYMDKMDMMQLALKEAQVGQLREQCEKFKLKETLLLLEQRAALSSLRGQIRGIEVQLQSYIDDYNALRAGVEQKLGISLNNYGVGDDGKLTEVPK